MKCENLDCLVDDKVYIIFASSFVHGVVTYSTTLPDDSIIKFLAVRMSLCLDCLVEITHHSVCEMCEEVVSEEKLIFSDRHADPKMEVCEACAGMYECCACGALRQDEWLLDVDGENVCEDCVSLEDMANACDDKSVVRNPIPAPYPASLLFLVIHHPPTPPPPPPPPSYRAPHPCHFLAFSSNINLSSLYFARKG
jgi:hypothetical protein